MMKLKIYSQSFRNAEVTSSEILEIKKPIIGKSIDNIVIERFWRSLKYDNVYPSSYENIKEARKGIREYIDILQHGETAFSIGLFNTWWSCANNKCFDAESVLLGVA